MAKTTFHSLLTSSIPGLTYNKNRSKKPKLGGRAAGRTGHLRVDHTRFPARKPNNNPSTRGTELKTHK